MNWSEGPLLAIDFETTGIDPFEARPVTVAMCAIKDRIAHTKLEVINAGIEIPEGATEIHGWSTAMVREQGEPPRIVIPDVAEMLRQTMAEGIPIVVFNARYDLTLLNEELRRLDLQPLIFEKVIDPFVIDKYLDRYRPGKRTLTALCDHYQVTLEEAHEAGSDAIAVARLAWRMGSEIPELGVMDLDDLHASQMDWAYDQAVNFKAWLVTTHGNTKPVPGGWPVQDGPDDDVELVEKKGRIDHLPAGWDSPYG